MHGAQPIGEGRPVWDDAAPPEDIATLDLGPLESLPKTPDVLVIGGGQVGLAIAARCAGAGMSTLLIERDRLAGGPSGRNGGFLLVDGHRSWPAAWRALSARAFELHVEFDGEAHFGLRRLDLWTTDDLILAGQGHANPLRVAAAYARAAGTVATRVEALTMEAGRVRTSHGDVTPGAVVFATGCCPPQAGDVVQDYVKGHVIATEPAAFSLDRLVVDGEVGVVQLEDGRLVCGGSKDFDDASTSVVDATVARLRGAMIAMVPEAADLGVDYAWSCFRPRVGDEFPVIDEISENVFVAAGLFSTGLLIAPAVGEALAGWIGEGKRPGGIESFALAREPLTRQAAQAPVPTGDLRPRA